MNNKHSITVVCIAPTVPRITISKHNKTFRKDFVLLHKCPVTIKVCTTTSGDNIVFYLVNILWSKLLISIALCIKTPNFEPLAAGFGAGYRRITDKQQLLESLQSDIKGKQPIIYEIDEADEFLKEMGKTVTYFS